MIATDIARKYGWTLEHKEYEGIMGFLPCNALGTKVYCVYGKDGRPLGYSQMGYEAALDRAIEKMVTLHIDLDRPAERQVVITFEEGTGHAFDVAMEILNHLHSHSKDPVSLTFTANIRETVAE